MSASIIRAAAFALLAGVACTPAMAQNSGNSEIDNMIRQQLEILQPGDTVTPLPEEEDPLVRKRKTEGTVQPGPETSELPPAIDPEPGVVDGLTDPDFNELLPEEEVVPKRRKPKTEVAEPVPGPGPDLAGPSADQIERQLDVQPRIRLAPSERVTIREFERRPDLRRAAPSIDIQAINFATGSAEIPFSQYRKVENIAIALERMLRRDPDTLLLIEGHTDAVGSFGSNQVLSQRRAASLKRVLVREFDIPVDALETVGYGEEYLLIPTTRENWRNRRVTLRVIDDFIR